MSEATASPDVEIPDPYSIPLHSINVAVTPITIPWTFMMTPLNSAPTPRSSFCLLTGRSPQSPAFRKIRALPL